MVSLERKNWRKEFEEAGLEFDTYIDEGCHYAIYRGESNKKLWIEVHVDDGDILQMGDDSRPEVVGVVDKNLQKFYARTWFDLEHPVGSKVLNVVIFLIVFVAMLAFGYWLFSVMGW